MEMELNDLIEKIKQEGVLEAEKQAAAIIALAEEKAKKIMEEAERKRSGLLQEAEAQTANFKKISEKAVKQASRDVLLSLREKVTDFFHRIVRIKVAEALTAKTLEQLIIKTVEAFKKDGIADIDIMMNQSDKLALEKNLFGVLGEEARKHITISASGNIEKGFMIGAKDKNSYFDFTDAALAEAFKSFLTPKLVDVLDAGADISTLK